MAGAGRILAPQELQEQASPGTPSTGFVYLYPKADGKLYIKDDGGVETDLTATAAGSSFASQAKWMTD